MEVIERAELDGGSIELASGKLAKQADGACVVRLGETVVLVTACFDKMPNNRGDFLPLTVDYREYTYAAGRVPGGWFKREGRPTEKETLTSRQIDRPLRPLFPKGYTHETQIVAGVLSADGAYDADVLALNGASAALMVSGCPFYTPIGAVRVGLVDGQFVVNPTHQQRAGAQLDLVVAGSENAVVMVEAGSTGISEAKILDAIDVAHAAIKVIIAAQRRLQAQVGKPKPAWTPPPPAWPQAFADAIHDRFYGPLAMALRVRGKLDAVRRHRRDRGRRGRLAAGGGARREGPLGQGDRPRDGARAVPLRRARQARAARRARVRPDPPRHLRGRPAAAHPRLGAVHPRRDAGARHLHPRHLGEHPDHRGSRGRLQAPLPAPLQLPAVLRRRGQVPARPRPARDRPRQPGAPRARPRPSPRKTSSRTRCAWSPTSSSPTAPRRWPPSAAAPSP